MLVRHYNRNTGSRKVRKLHPDAELELHLAARDAAGYRSSEPSLRGAGIVTAPRVVKYRKPKSVRRNSGYYKPGRKLGPRYTTQEASYLELMQDVNRKRPAKVAKPTTITKVVRERTITAADLPSVQNYEQDA